MTGQSNIRKGSARSYAHEGSFNGIVVSTKDPENRGRVQVRYALYSDPSLSKDMMEWVNVGQQDSQIAGHTSTQPYKAGSQVSLGNLGGESYISHGAPGFDSEKRLAKPDPPQADSSGPSKPDKPNMLRGEKHTAIRSSSGLRPTAEHGVTKYFDYSNWAGMAKTMFPYSLGTGEPPAPFGKGTKAKLHALQTIGIQKLKKGSDVLDTIKGMDDNISGAFQPAVDIIKHLRMGGYGNGIEVMGGGNMGKAEAQFNGTFGKTPGSNVVANDLIALILALIAAIRFVRGLTAANLYDNTSSDAIVVTPLSDVRCNVSGDNIDAIAQAFATVSQSGPDLPQSFYAAQLAIVLDNFNTAISTAVTSIIENINSIAAVSTNPTDIINSFGGAEQFTEMAQDLSILCSLVNIPASVVNSIANGLIGLALAGKLPKTVISQANTGNQGGGGDNPNSASSQSKWGPNSIAMQELMSGQLVKDFLTKIPKKYRDAKENDGEGTLKKHPDKQPNYSVGADNPQSYTDASLGMTDSSIMSAYTSTG